MTTDVEQWIETCKVCQAYEMRRGVPRAKADMPRVIPNRPWASVYIDAVGPLPRGDGGYQYILVAIDHFTRWVEMKAVRRLTAETFVDWMQHDLINRWGPMVRVTTDRGSNFVSDVAKAVYEAVGVERHRITAWRPQSNGLVERFNGTLKQLLKAYAEETGSGWPRGITNYMYAYNTAVHSATGFTPFYLMHGWEAKLPYELLLEQRGKSEYRSVNEYVEGLVVAVNDCWQAAAMEMEEGDRRKHWSPATTARKENPMPTFEVGQQVLVRKPFRSAGESKATRRQWYGPYEVLDKVSDLVYVIAREGYDDEVHVDRLKRYRTLDQDGPRFRYKERVKEEEGEAEREGEIEVSEEVEDRAELRLFPEEPGERDEEDQQWDEVRKEEEEGNCFEVEAILDRRVLRSSARLDRGQRMEYLVKWKHWPDTEATWERGENLEGCRELVWEYEKMHKLG